MKEEHQGRVTVMAAADGGCGGGGALENGRKEGRNEGEGRQKREDGTKVGNKGTKEGMKEERQGRKERCK